jgi:Ca2+-binding RTX toxin-like protein
VTVYPEELNNFSLPAITSITDLTQTFLDMAAASTLARTDGRTMIPYIAVIPDLVHHQDVLPGNDTILGGEGNDTIVGDNAVFFAPLLTGLPELDKALANVTGALIAATDALHKLSLDFDLYEHQVLHVVHDHDVIVGQDVLDGQGGDDTIFGDYAMFASAFMTGLPVSGLDFMPAALEFQALLNDMRTMTVDFGFVVQEAHLQVLTDLTADALANNPDRIKTPTKDIHNPDYHALYINSDVIDTGAGNDTVFGDDAIYFTPVVNGQTYTRPLDYLNVTKAEYYATRKALALQARAAEKELKLHVKNDHASAADFRKRLPPAADLALATFPYEYSRYVGNDTIIGGDGNVLIEADIAVLTMPIIVTAPVTKQEIAQAARDARAVSNTIKSYVAKITSRNTGTTYFAKKASQFGDRRKAGADKMVFSVANDVIVGGTRTNQIFGGGLFLTIPFDMFAPDHQIDLGNFSVSMPSLQESRRANLNSSLNGQRLTKDFANDIITVNGTADTVYGGGGKNSITFGPGAILIRKTSSHVPSVKTAIPMRQFMLSNLSSTVSSAVLGQGSALFVVGSTGRADGLFHALFL